MRWLMRPALSWQTSASESSALFGHFTQFQTLHDDFFRQNGRGDAKSLCKNLLLMLWAPPHIWAGSI